MIPFFRLCPDTASRETRTLHVPPGNASLPEGEFHLVEWFCTDAKCDCRRALIGVCRMGPGFDPHKALVTISFGWASTDHYMRWSRGDPANADDVAHAKQLKGATPELLAGFPDEVGERLYDAVVKLVLSDPAYVARLERHYAEFRAKLKPAAPGGLRWNLRGKRKPQR